MYIVISAYYWLRIKLQREYLCDKYITRRKVVHGQYRSMMIYYKLATRQYEEMCELDIKIHRGLSYCGIGGWLSIMLFVFATSMYHRLLWNGIFVDSNTLFSITLQSILQASISPLLLYIFAMIPIILCINR